MSTKEEAAKRVGCYKQTVQTKCRTSNVAPDRMKYLYSTRFPRCSLTGFENHLGCLQKRERNTNKHA